MEWLRQPKVWQRIALGVVVFHVLLWIVAEIFGWINDTAFIARLSLDALVLAGLAWYVGTRVEVKQDEDADVAEVLDKIDDIKEEM